MTFSFRESGNSQAGGRAWSSGGAKAGRGVGNSGRDALFSKSAGIGTTFMAASLAVTERVKSGQAIPHGVNGQFGQGRRRAFGWYAPAPTLILASSPPLAISRR